MCWNAETRTNNGRQGRSHCQQATDSSWCRSFLLILNVNVRDNLEARQVTRKALLNYSARNRSRVAAKLIRLLASSLKSLHSAGFKWIALQCFKHTLSNENPLNVVWMKRYPMEIYVVRKWSGPFMSVFALLLFVCSHLSALLVCLCLCVVLYKSRPLEPENSMTNCGPWHSFRVPSTLRVPRSRVATKKKIHF